MRCYFHTLHFELNGYDGQNLFFLKKLNSLNWCEVLPPPTLSIAAKWAHTNNPPTPRTGAQASDREPHLCTCLCKRCVQASGSWHVHIQEQKRKWKGWFWTRFLSSQTSILRVNTYVLKTHTNSHSKYRIECVYYYTVMVYKNNNIANTSASTHSFGGWWGGSSSQYIWNHLSILSRLNFN